MSTENYLEHLNQVIDSNSHIRGFRSRLAEAAKCQRSYFSQILRGEKHLTLEQAAGIAVYLEMDELETEVFLTKVELERAGTKELKNILRSRLVSAQQRQLDIAKQTKGVMVPAKIMQAYYGTWYWMAIHMALSIDRFQDLKTLARHLNLEHSVVEKCVGQLVTAGLLEQKEHKWRLKEKNFHLPKSSPLIRVNHLNWRQKAVEDLDKESPSSMHYTSVFALSKKDTESLRKKLMTVLKEFRSEISNSPPEEMYCFNLDWFSV